MSETHTPGPWKWEGNDLDTRWLDFDALRGGNGQSVLVGCWHNDSTAGVGVGSVHDAHLIAAAPEMKAGLLAAIEALEDTAAQAGLAVHHTAALPHQRTWLRGEVLAIAKPAIKALRALIAQSEGKS